MRKTKQLTNADWMTSTLTLSLFEQSIFIVWKQHKFYNV